MKIIINVSNNLISGGLQVALSFLNECSYIDINTYHVFLGKNISQEVNTKIFSNNFKFYYITKIKPWNSHSILSKFEKKIQPDCVFTVFGPSYWKPKAPHLMGFANGYHIYFDYKFMKNLSIFHKFKWFFKRFIHLYLIKYQADFFVVETEDAQQRLKNKINRDTVETVSNTCGSHYFSPRQFENKLPPKKENEVRMITITGYYPHKNLETIPKVLEELNSRNINYVTFTVTLNNKDYERIIPIIWRHMVYNVGTISPFECPSLYKECDILYQPTLLEIFSVSYLEAMAMKKPIITSNLSFARSICGESALYFDPFSIKDIADKIEFIIKDSILQTMLVEKGNKKIVTFGTAKERAVKYLEICKKISMR